MNVYDVCWRDRKDQLTALTAFSFILFHQRHDFLLKMHQAFGSRAMPDLTGKLTALTDPLA